MYALNWTSEVPAEGLAVTVSGEWQTCTLGGAYDLNKDGFWSKSPESVKPNSKFMTVGGVRYSYPGVDGIHIVIGIQNADGNFDIIYVDPTSLAKGSSAKYQPQETVQWWYQTDMRSSTMISTAVASQGSVDLSKPGPITNEYYYSTTYNHNSGTWITSEDEPNEVLYAPPQESFTAEAISPPSLWPTIVKAIFKIAVSTDKQASASASLKGLLDARYKDVSSV